MASALPVIDLASPPAEAAAHIDAALRDTGFYAITGHGVPQPVIDAAFDAGHRFFALAEETKRRWHVDLSKNHRGFDPIGWQALDPSRPPDLKESFYLGVEAFGPNPWPDEALVPGFQAAMRAYQAAMDGLAKRLMGVYEIALGLPAGHFDAFMRQPICTTRLLHYPPQPEDGPGGAAPGQIGCGAHTDWGALTLLLQDEAGGLQLQRRDGSWMDVPPVPGALIVNVGDLMQRWTNDRWISNQHRVINRLSGRDRWSIAYFFDLDGDATIVPLAPCTSSADPPRYGPITPAQHLAEMYRRTTVATA